MAEIKTVFTDDDGDGFYDDVHHVVAHDEDNSSYYAPTKERTVHMNVGSSSDDSIFKYISKKKILIVLGILLGLSLGIKFFYCGAALLYQFFG